MPTHSPFRHHRLTHRERSLCRIPRYMWARISVQIHESQQQPRINPAAEEQANGHITDKMSFNWLLVERKQLFSRLVV